MLMIRVQIAAAIHAACVRGDGGTDVSFVGEPLHVEQSDVGCSSICTSEACLCLGVNANAGKCGVSVRFDERYAGVRL
jgi:hypothetical protein